MPRGWIYVADFGIRQMPMEVGAIVASVGLGQDTLSAESSVAEYIEKQRKLIESHLKDARFAGPQAIVFPGTEEGHLLFVRHSMDAVGNMLHVQTYVRQGEWLGIVTLTTLETQLSTVRPDYDAFVKGLHISSPRVDEPAGTS